MTPALLLRPGSDEIQLDVVYARGPVASLDEALRAVCRGEQVEWEPAMDATKMALRGMLVAIVFLFVVRSVVKTFAGR